MKNVFPIFIDKKRMRILTELNLYKLKKTCSEIK